MIDLLFVGRPSPEKGLCDLLVALERVQPRWRLHIAGARGTRDCVSVPRFDYSRIHEYGPLCNAEIAELMRRIDVLVVPSRYESFGNVALEGMASGRVIIAARTGGMIDMITDGVTGLQFPPGDVSALSQRLACVIARPKTFRYLGVAARQAALAYSWENVSQATARLLRGLF